ncbi:right-handed parallel beta-helix repeat-containing protein [Streptomyces sp. NBC_01808]|uniref:right-handed parallel beta-helix repeat-containing protein n=1 Tax=Streptomyces sp. NBC_01808 TaxID=2975947 RepID=UPI002DDC2C7F|nr:right-handed parallel beta-helix repeat-containing protein [Streptomyces sp. NBC_01808]WSA35978.1 right-handed parallel beta-helix repeat-containing protein [Streptomyces sp. NBC_01808]
MAAGPFTVVVAPDGPGQAPEGDVVVRSITAAKAVARTSVRFRDTLVLLDGGTYELDEPLRFDARDGGAHGHTVTWAGAPGERAVLSGGEQVTGWKLHDREKNIWVADVAEGTESRQLYVDGQLAEKTRLRLAEDEDDRGHLTWTERGLVLADDRFGDLGELRNQSDMEIVSLGSFTDRISPVEEIAGDEIRMVQPAWENNNFGYDTLKSPYNRGALYLVNAYEFFDAPDQWYLDSPAGKVYYSAEPGATMAGIDVRLPRLETLAEIGGTRDRPVRGLTFRDLQFSHTTWMRPSSAWGYADQQSGAHVVGRYDPPADYLTTCQDGCPEFEETRNEWWQVPGAVQVSAASDVAFRDNDFDQLGSVALGIGMDPNAHATGVGYGTSDIDVAGNTISDTAGSGIVVGGVQPNAHHPADRRMVNHDVRITDNTITGTGQNYRDSAGVLATYVTRATISHNTLTDLPYDGIDIGWGWGSNDPGGNRYYKEAGLYEYQPVYETPTTFRDNRVSHNLIYDTKNDMHDGGSIYSLSASPGTVIERNYIYDSRETFGMLIDQGSRYMTVRENVILDSSRYIYVNADEEGPEIFNTLDCTFTGNWWTGGNERSPEGPGYNLTWTGNVDLNDVAQEEWPDEAKRVMDEAGARR